MAVTKIIVGMPLTIQGKLYQVSRIDKRIATYVTQQDSETVKSFKRRTCMYQKFEVADFEVGDTITDINEEVRLEAVDQSGPLVIVVEQIYKKEEAYGQQAVSTDSESEEDSATA